MIVILNTFQNPSITAIRNDFPTRTVPEFIRSHKTKKTRAAYAVLSFTGVYDLTSGL